MSLFLGRQKYENVKVKVNTTLQSKSATPSTSAQTITPDSGYDGLSSVAISAIPSGYVQPSGTRSITSNGTYDVKNYANATVNVASSGTGTMWSGKVTTSNTTYTVYYCTGQGVNSVYLTSERNISVPNYSMIVVYSSWGPISTRTKTNVEEVTSAVDGEYCGCQSGLAVYKVTGNNFTLGFY